MLSWWAAVSFLLSCLVTSSPSSVLSESVSPGSSKLSQLLLSNKPPEHDTIDEDDTDDDELPSEAAEAEELTVLDLEWWPEDDEDEEDDLWPDTDEALLLGL